MKRFSRTFLNRKRLLAFSAMMIGAFLLMSLLIGSKNVSANHPILVEGNCDHPAPGNVTPHVSGTCGDYDGDGRIGAQEDTDSPDRIFGTIRAALGAGIIDGQSTGANHNGTITIVTSGRFSEPIHIGDSGFVEGQGSGSPGNVTLQAAPGVEANIDAVFQGDPAGGNNARQGVTGITIIYNSPNRRVTLRNLTIRNWAWGLYTSLNSHVTVDNCRFENNLNYGIQAVGFSRLFVMGSRIISTGFRIGTGVSTVANPGHAISYEGAASGEVAQSQIVSSFGRALSNTGTGTVTYYELFLGDNGAGIINATRNNTP